MISTKNPFFFLLGGLLVTLLAAPITTEHFPGLTGLMITGTLLIAVLSMSASKGMYMAAWSLVAAKIALDVVDYINPSVEIYMAEVIVLFAFFVVATAFAFRRVLEDEYVDMNRIAGAISVYMLIGLIWACLNFFLSLLDIQAFKGLVNLSSPDVKVMDNVFMDLLYYSYVTLSTLGYGDITPISRTAQALAYLEAICGVMYVAVLVSALVGSYGNKRVAQA